MNLKFSIYELYGFRKISRDKLTGLSLAHRGYAYYSIYH